MSIVDALRDGLLPEMDEASMVLALTGITPVETIFPGRSIRIVKALAKQYRYEDPCSESMYDPEALIEIMCPEFNEKEKQNLLVQMIKMVNCGPEIVEGDPEEYLSKLKTMFFTWEFRLPPKILVTQGCSSFAINGDLVYGQGLSGNVYPLFRKGELYKWIEIIQSYYDTEITTFK